MDPEAISAWKMSHFKTRFAFNVDMPFKVWDYLSSGTILPDSKHANKKMTICYMVETFKMQRAHTAEHIRAGA